MQLGLYIHLKADPDTDSTSVIGDKFETAFFKYYSLIITVTKYTLYHYNQTFTNLFAITSNHLFSICDTQIKINYFMNAYFIINIFGAPHYVEFSYNTQNNYILVFAEDSDLLFTF